MSTFDFLSLQYGLCPRCDDSQFTKRLKIQGDLVVCPDACGFTMATEKYNARLGKKKNGSRSYGWWKVQHNSVTEAEKMEDIARVN